MESRSFRYIKRAIRAEASVAECVARTALAIVIPTLLRWFIDRGALGAPFVLYFPAIQMIATFLGWRWGAVTAVGSGIVAWVMFLPPQIGLDLTLGQMVVLALFALSAATMVLIGHLLRNSVLQLEERARQSDDFNRELQHRTKNSLQMMRALASQASKATDPAEFYEKLAGRLTALAKANELLRFGAVRSCSMLDLVSAAVAPFNSEQFDIVGAPGTVSRNACTPLMMALHELGTNASKYGALSVPSGRVGINWEAEEATGLVAVKWRESGGPVVSQPAHTGLGSRLLKASGQLKRVELEFAPGGVRCELCVVQE